MARFQSRLFNWIDRSLPTQLGRKARLFYEQWYENLGRPTKEIPQTIGKQTAKVILYPAYLLAKVSAKLNPRLQAAPPVPLFLRPIQALVLWADHSTLFVRDVREFTKDPESTAASPQSRKSKKLPRTNSKVLGSGSTGKLNAGFYDRQLERLQQLIQAAIAYFFGKKTTNDQVESTTDQGDKSGLAAVLAQDLQPTSAKSPYKSKNKSKKLPRTSSKVLGSGGTGELNTGFYDQQLEQLQQLIQAAIAYFFGKKPPKHKFKSSQTPQIKQNINQKKQIQQSDSPWLTMADVFDDDMTPWPALPKPENSGLLNPQSSLAHTNQAGDLDSNQLNHEITSTTAQGLTEWEENPPPGRAWIDTPATFLGYVYSPVMQLIHWLDRLIAGMEKWVIQIFLGLCQFVKSCFGIKS